MPDSPRNDTTELITLSPRRDDDATVWTPHEGNEASQLLAVLNRIPPREKETLLQEAGTVLGRCLNPERLAPNNTGLVVGYVQSGKTASFTTVAALARDNNYRMVVVITGVSSPLLGQSSGRLERDLQLAFRNDRKWRHLSNPSLTASGASQRVTTTELQNVLDVWREPRVPANQRQALLITVMKNHTHLRKLTALLRTLDLRDVPVLIIDDEADQAGLNTRVNVDDQSTTYKRILELREALPNHSYLQYTATPQAPLLISLADELSPDFVSVLTPGADYVGGIQFFENHPELLKVIPEDDVISAGDDRTGPPESLLDALRAFFLGAAAGVILDEMQGNRSMLIHPSQGTGLHTKYFGWVSNIKREWLATLELEAGNADREELLADFQPMYAELRETVGEGLPPFETLVEYLPLALRQTREQEVNAARGQTPQIRWQDSYGHILVGGQAMDRGFTVEGLTVTYMPRGIGVGNADTIQQRARFFGYKRSYLGFCRVYLGQETLDAFRSYVRHECHMRRELELHAATGLPLSEWKRRFLIAPELKATRREVLSLPSMRLSFRGAWFTPKVILDSPENLRRNRELVERFEGLANVRAGEGRGEDRNLVSHDVSIQTIIEELLAQYKVGDLNDSVSLTALTIQLQVIAEEHPDARCTVYVMGRGENPDFLRKRPVDEQAQTLSAETGLFQGRSSNYPGDTQLPSNVNPLQLQIHHLSLRRGNIEGTEVARDVCVIAAKISPEIDDVIIESR
jgi:Z1 domain.